MNFDGVYKCKYTYHIFLDISEMARDSAVGRERVLPGSLALDNSTSNQHVASVQNDLNQQILEVSINCCRFFSLPSPSLQIDIYAVFTYLCVSCLLLVSFFESVHDDLHSQKNINQFEFENKLNENMKYKMTMKKKHYQQ